MWGCSWDFGAKGLSDCHSTAKYLSTCSLKSRSIEYHLRRLRTQFSNSFIVLKSTLLILTLCFTFTNPSKAYQKGNFRVRFIVIWMSMLYFPPHHLYKSACHINNLLLRKKSSHVLANPTTWDIFQTSQFTYNVSCCLQ